MELAGLKFGGPAGRWAVIVAVQVNYGISSSHSVLRIRKYLSGSSESYPEFQCCGSVPGSGLDPDLGRSNMIHENRKQLIISSFEVLNDII